MSAAAEVLVVATGVANLASVEAGLRRAGARARITEDAAAVTDAERVVLPGVGAFAAGIERLRALDLVDTLRARIAADRPTLAVCLGLQLLGEGSDESPECEGLGVLAARATRFGEGVRVPQLGWNRVTPDAGCRTLAAGFAYFANSYRLADAPAGWGVAWADHGGRFVAGLERGNVLACQFHPELSGRFGHELLCRWLEGTAC